MKRRTGKRGDVDGLDLDHRPPVGPADIFILGLSQESHSGNNGKQEETNSFHRNTPDSARSIDPEMRIEK
jgi:hypothetical protein